MATEQTEYPVGKLGEMQKWADEHGGIDAVRNALANGAFGARAEVARLFISNHDRLEQEARDRRMLEATESQAASAKSALRLSRWAIRISIAAVLIALLTWLMPRLP